MIHNKQHYLLYFLLLSFQAQHISAALVAVAEAGSVMNTAAYVAREAVASTLGTAGGVVSGAPAASEVQAHVSMESIMNAVADVTSENVLAPSSDSSSSSSDSGPSFAEKSTELRAATDNVLQCWARNREILSAITRISPASVENSLFHLSRATSSQAPVKIPAVADYVNALEYVVPRQESAYLKSQLNIILPCEVEILAPTTVGDLTVVLPPVSVVDFLPKQEIHLLVNAVGDNTLSVAEQKQVMGALRDRCVANGLLSPMKSSSVAAQEGTLAKFCESIKKYTASIQKALAQTLQAQNEAEMKAQNEAVSGLWDIFQEKYEKVRKGLGLLKADPAINEMLPGTMGQKFLQIYVEGALECLVYDLTIYSSIAKIADGGAGAIAGGSGVGNGGGSDIVRYVNSKSGKDMLYYMIFGAALVGGGAALANDDEEGLKNRILASAAAVKLTIKNADKMDPNNFVEIFAQSAYYLVTGRVLELDPVKKAEFIKVLQQVRGITQKIQAKPAEAVTQMPQKAELVEGVVVSIPAWQAYGLNFQQSTEELMSDVMSLLEQQKEYADTIDFIRAALSGNPKHAEVLKAALFAKAADASFMDKCLHLKKRTTNAIKGMGKVVSGAIKRGALDNADVSDDEADHFVAPVLSEQKAELDQLLRKEIEKVDRGEQTADQAMARAKSIVGANGVIPTVIVEQLTVLKNEELAQLEEEARIKAQRDAAAQKFLESASKSLLDGFEKMLNDSFDDYADSLKDLKTVQLEELQALNKVRDGVLQTKEEIRDSAFVQRVSANLSLIDQAVSKLDSKLVSLADANKVIQAVGINLWGSDKPGLRSYVQGYAQAVMFVRKSKARKMPVVISNGQVVQVVDVVKALAA